MLAVVRVTCTMDDGPKPVIHGGTYSTLNNTTPNGRPLIDQQGIMGYLRVVNHHAEAVQVGPATRAPTNLLPLTMHSLAIFATHAALPSGCDETSIGYLNQSAPHLRSQETGTIDTCRQLSI